MITQSTDNTSLMAAYRRGNNAGEGYSIGSDAYTPREAIEDSADLEWLRYIHAEGACLARRDDGALVVVGDAHGPWAVTVAEPPALCRDAMDAEMVAIKTEVAS
jgi:hypothetical protein